MHAWIRTHTHTNTNTHIHTYIHLLNGVIPAISRSRVSYSWQAPPSPHPQRVFPMLSVKRATASQSAKSRMAQAELSACDGGLQMRYSCTWMTIEHTRRHQHWEEEKKSFSFFWNVPATWPARKTALSSRFACVVGSAGARISRTCSAPGWKTVTGVALAPVVSSGMCWLHVKRGKRMYFRK
jgi:hypothetical protein